MTAKPISTLGGWIERLGPLHEDQMSAHMSRHLDNIEDPSAHMSRHLDIVEGPSAHTSRHLDIIDGRVLTCVGAQISSRPECLQLSALGCYHQPSTHTSRRLDCVMGCHEALFGVSPDLF